VVLRSSALTTVEAVKADQGSASGLEARTRQDNVDSRLERLIEASSEEIRNYCNRNFEHVEDHQEFVSSSGNRYIRLMHAPIESVDKIEWVDRSTGDVIQEIERWGIEDAEAGLIYRPELFPFYVGAQGFDLLVSDRINARLRVTYTGGFVTPTQAAVMTDPPDRTLPFAVEEVCVREVITRFWGRNRNREIETSTSNNATSVYRERRGLLPSSQGALQPFWLGLPS